MASPSEAAADSARWDRAAWVIATFPAAAGLILASTVGIGLWGALERTSLTASRLPLAALTVLVLLVWLAIATVASRTRAYERSAPLAVAMILVPVVLGVVLLGTSTTSAEVLAVAPPAWPIEFQAVRILGGLFLVAWLAGEMEKPWFCVWAGSMDVVIGLTAVPVAWWVATSAPAAAAVGVIWNLAGLLDFAVASVIVLRDRTMIRDFLTSAGPVVTLLRPVFRTIFSFAVPLMSIIHVMSIRQLL